MAEYRVQYRGTAASVRKARRAILDYARRCGFAGEETFEIALGVGEALANAVEHGCRNRGALSVACSFENGELVVDVTDSGLGFDHASQAGKVREPSAIRGFGIAIMHAVMDSVTYEPDGTTVRLTKRLPHRADV